MSLIKDLYLDFRNDWFVQGLVKTAVAMPLVFFATAILTSPITCYEERAKSNPITPIRKSTEYIPTKVVHEYLDLNENGLYDTYRLVYEREGQRVIDHVTWYGEDYTEEYIRKNYVPQGNDIRFISVKK